MIARRMLGNWAKGHEYCRQLRENCSWSLPTFYYFEAVFLYMDLESRLLEDRDQFSQSKECANMLEHISELMRYVSNLGESSL